MEYASICSILEDNPPIVNVILNLPDPYNGWPSKQLHSWATTVHSPAGSQAQPGSGRGQPGSSAKRLIRTVAAGCISSGSSMGETPSLPIWTILFSAGACKSPGQSLPAALAVAPCPKGGCSPINGTNGINQSVESVPSREFSTEGTGPLVNVKALKQ